MSEILKVAVAGVGRMGAVHARHVHELAQETGNCELAALVDHDMEAARRCSSELGSKAPVFASLEEFAKAGVCNATVIATPTPDHREHASTLIAAGHRVLLEKPLTASIEADREFAAELDRDHPNALMLAFQRRFDPPLAYT